MTSYSPLRYPGGKAKLAKYISNLCVSNNIDNIYLEPYCGGAGVALYLLIEKYVKKIILNDIDKSVFAFWHTVLNDAESLCKKINDTPINIEEWEKQKQIQKIKDEVSLFELGFSTLYLNRCNFSGIINAGPIGGKQQKSKYKIDSRFNKKEIIRRIRKIGQYSDQIIIYNKDTYELLSSKLIKKMDKRSLIYLDPPYFEKGKYLYENHYSFNDHKKISDKVKKINNTNWLISYDNVETITNLYTKCRQKNITINHSAYKPKKGSEILVFSSRLNST